MQEHILITDCLAGRQITLILRSEKYTDLSVTIR